MGQTLLEVQKQRTKEFLAYVQEKEKMPSKIRRVYFTDGTSMYHWFHNFNRYLKEYKDKIETGEQQLPLPETYKLFEEMVEKVSLIILGKEKYMTRDDKFFSRIEQYKQKVLELGHMIVESDHCLFEDGISMNLWYTRTKSYYRGHLKDIRLDSENYLKFKELVDFFYKEGYESTLIDHTKLTFQERANVFLEKFQKYQNLSDPDFIQETFSDVDVSRVASWYRNQVKKIKEERDKYDTLSEERKVEIEIFARMENDLLKIKDSVHVRKPEVPVEEKFKICTEIVKELRRFPKRGELIFKDEVDVWDWISSKTEVRRVLKEYIESEAELSYEECLEEYRSHVETTKVKPKARDKIYFSRGKLSMPYWYFFNSNKIEKERAEEVEITPERMAEIHSFALLDDYLLSVDPKACHKLNNKSTLQRIDEYEEQVHRLKRKIGPSDNIKFSDGVDMHWWYQKETRRLQNIEVDDFSGSPQELKELKRWLELKKVVESYKKLKRSTTARKNSFELYQDKIDFYIEQVHRLKRNATKDDRLRFSSGQYLTYFYDKETERFEKEFQEGTFNPIKLNRVHAFALLENVIWDYENQNKKDKVLVKKDNN